MSSSGRRRSVGYPLSTTHVMSGWIMRAGAGKRLPAVPWGVAANIVAGWVVTLPAAAIFDGLLYALSTLFGHNAIGPLVISTVLLLALTAVSARRAQATPAPGPS